MSEMVERVARALSIAAGMHPDACSNDEDETPMWTLYVDDARAAIEAMREPTEGMLTVGEDVIFDEEREYELEELSKLPTAWQAMIDEALK